MSNATTVTAAAMEESGLATLLLRADKALRHRPLSEVWLLVPQLSRWQWHVSRHLSMLAQAGGLGILLSAS